MISLANRVALFLRLRLSCLVCLRLLRVLCCVCVIVLAPAIGVTEEVAPERLASLNALLKSSRIL